MKRKIFWILAGLLLALAAGLVFRLGPFSGLGGSGAGAGKLKVAASFYPMAEFARQVGGDKVEVTTLVPAGSEPHDFDPTPQEIAAVHKARVFVYNGAGMEPWADKIAPELDAAGAVVVRASDGIQLISGGGGPATADPHVWLDPVLAQKEVDNIRDGLIRADPENREAYTANAAAYKEQLAGLDREYRTALSACGRKDIVTSHQAFGYLARRYGLEVVAIAGLSPDAEPSPEQLARAAAFAREHGVSYIFFEKLVSPRLAQTVASEVGARTLVFDPLEGLTQQEIDQGKNYISVQRDNIQSLRLALSCR